MVGSFLVLEIECFVAGGVQDHFPGFPQVMSIGKVLPLDKVIVAGSIVCTDLGVEFVFHNVCLVSTHFDLRRQSSG